jgi:hypothetical protein
MRTLVELQYTLQYTHTSVAIVDWDIKDSVLLWLVGTDEEVVSLLIVS